MVSHVSINALPGKRVSLCESSQETLRDHFCGALLGLWLAPVAVSLGGESRSIINDSVGTGSFGPTPNYPEMAAMLVDGFALIQLFALEADAFRQPLSVILETALADPDTHPLPVWLVSLPMLLRYHDSRLLRLQWLDAQQSSLQAVAHANRLSWTVATEQIIQLGDFLEMALSGWTDSLLDYVTELRGEMLSQSTTQMRVDHDFAKVLLSAFGGPSEGAFALSSVFPPAFLPAKACKGEQMLLLGFLMGVLQGASRLPVLWQMTCRARAVYGCDLRDNAVSRAVIVGMAHRLFEQWAGIRPI